MNCLHGLRREQWFRPRAAARNHQALLDVLAGIRFIEWRKVRSQRNPLLQRPQLKRVEFQIEFGLPNKDDLQKLVVVRLEIRKQPNLFQKLHRKIVRFIHDEDRGESLKPPRSDILAKVKQEGTFALTRIGLQP